MRTSILTSLLVLLSTGSLQLYAQGTPDTGNSRLWEMRKKVQQRSMQRAGSYLEQMNQSMAAGDGAGAESALKAAIAQGTMTQPQIDEARERIDALVSKQQRERAEAERAKMATAQVRDEATRSTTSNSSGSGNNATARQGSITVQFKGAGMFWMQSARVFNIDATGRETSLHSSASPGNVGTGQSKGAKNNTSSMQVSLFPGKASAIAGRYGFKAVWTRGSNPNLVGEFRDVDARAELEGTFEIPAGASEVWIEYDKSSPTKVRVQSFK